MGFKDESTFEKRFQLSEKIRQNYPDRIPVIVESYKKENLQLSNGRFLINDTDTVHKLIYEVRKKIENLRKEEALFFFCCNNDKEFLAPATNTIGQIYEKHKDNDGFLYFFITKEQVYGLQN